MLLNNEAIDFSLITASGYFLSEEEINNKYQEGEMRIITETGRYPLQNIVAILSKNIEFEPHYQRRRVWTPVQKSRLIESFIMNVPIPPVFLYEVDFSKYEVMDGLQRLSTLYEFYSNKFALTGLEIWPELNGMKYSDLPAKVRSGIDRRYISTIVILKETAKTPEEEQILKKFVFERLNTGGTKLTDQETRNALYDGRMNRLCIRIAQECKVFHKLWRIKPYKQEAILTEIENSESEEDIENVEQLNTYVRMEDVELVLRYFAYRQLNENPASKVKAILDLYLQKANDFDEILLSNLEKTFYSVLGLADKIFGVQAFSMYTKKKKSGKYSWNTNPSKLVYDPMLMALSGYIDDEMKKKILIENKDDIKKRMEAMFVEESDSFNGRNSGKNDVLRRKIMYQELFDAVIQEHVNG